MVEVPSGVVPDVVNVTVLGHVGRHDGAEKLAVVPAGRPLAVKLTAAGVPDTSVAVTLFPIAFPCTTDTLPPFPIEKSNGG
jgi:hypothetical protein